MDRIVKAFFNSVAAWRFLIRSEKAFQQEAVLLALSLPLAFFVAADARGWVILVGSVVLIMIVEVLNTGIEAVCDAVSPEFDANIKIAKDCGSLAVLLSIAIAAVVWGLALWQRFAA
jgi:diacylglycerol kinase (ATP)